MITLKTVVKYMVVLLALSLGSVPSLDAAKKRLSHRTAAAATEVAAEPSLPSSFNADRLRDVAETQGFGYKTANLKELQTVCAIFNHKPGPRSVRLEVPEFLGVPSNKIQEKLLAVGFNCATEWARVVATIPAADQVQAFKDKQFLAVFLAARDSFNRAFNQAWGRITLSPGQGLNALLGVMGLDEILARGNRLMVRSTGKEDTKELANAGGNASVANVDPTAVAVLAAMREVVESYFGMKSLTQRLGLGDRTLFSPELFMPVLVQEMIGEKAEDVSPPSCGVMFTEEPEGHVAPAAAGAGGAAPAYKTTGITLIQAAYGHNEAVVNSLVSVDTYYVTGGKSPAVYPIIRAKKSRLVPVGDSSTLVMQPNKKELVMVQALSSNQIAALKSLADYLEQYYGYAMDVEFVAKGKTIFIVQARPIVHKEGSAAPSYLRDGIVGGLFKGASIGAAGGSVRVIDAADQMLVAPTIGVALNTYLSKDFDRKNLKAVLVGAMAPSTSHEATTFRNEGFPVLFVEQWDSLVNSVSSGKKLLVSPQQNMALAVDSLAVSDILPGWNSYPVPRALSVRPALIGTLKKVLLPKAPDPVRGKSVAWSALLATMKTGDRNAVIASTAQFLAQLAEIFKKYAAHKTLSSDVKDLQEGAMILCQQVVSLSHRAIDNKRYLSRLLPIKMLEAIVYQQLDARDVFKPLSLATLGTIVKDEAVISAGGSIVKRPARSAAAGGATSAEPGAPADVVPVPTDFALPGMKDYYVQLRKLDNNIFIDSVRNDWGWLLGQAAGNKEMIESITQLVKQLTDVLLLPTWLHSDFATTMRDEIKRNPENISAALTKWQAHLSRDKAFLGLLLEKYAIIKGMNLSAFADAGRCHAAWRQFNEQVVSYFSTRSSTFKTTFAAAGPYGRLSAVKMLRELITAFDEGVKGVKGNPAMLMVDKLALFKTMLQVNFSLLQNVASLVPRRKTTTEIDALEPIAGNTPREESWAMIQRVLDKDFSSVDLLPTLGISTFIFAMGSGHDWAEQPSQPQTGEDIFSMMHQSLLNICGLLSGNVGLAIDRPTVLQNAEDALIRAGGEIRLPWLSHQAIANFTGSDVASDAMTIYYNIPLGSHSCLASLIYSNKTKLVTVAAHFCGGQDCERGRWCKIAINALLADNIDEMKTSLNELSNHLVSVSLIFGASGIAVFQSLWRSLIAAACSSYGKVDGFIEWKDADAKRSESTDKALIQKLLSFSNDGIGGEAAFYALLRYDLFGDSKFGDIVQKAVDLFAQNYICSNETIESNLEKIAQSPQYDLAILMSIVSKKWFGPGVRQERDLDGSIFCKALIEQGNKLIDQARKIDIVFAACVEMKKHPKYSEFDEGLVAGISDLQSRIIALKNRRVPLIN